MSDWTPTTKQVREDYATRMAPHLDGTRRDMFDRWLKQVKADAWDEGHHAGQHNEHEHRAHKKMQNPYRQETNA